MGATSKALAVTVIGLTIVGCGLTRQAGREVAQRAADDSRCRNYGFKTDAISRAVGCSLISRGFDAAVPVAVVLAELLQTRIHYRCRYFVAMRSRAETRYRCLRCVRRPRSRIRRATSAGMALLVHG